MKPIISGKFTPPPGQTLLIIGQDVGAVADYAATVSADPGGVTTYSDISEGGSPLLSGLSATVDYGSGKVNGQQMVDDYPHSTLAIGLNLVDYTGKNLTHIADGTHDKAVDELGQFIKDANRPVYLRIGYEFDGEWNHYEPEAYIAAYRHIVDRLRANGVDNFATVWQSATFPYGRYQERPFLDWYPGDDYVDWFGASYFEFDRAIFDEFLDLARTHNKPVLIAESTPRGYDLEALTYGSPNGTGGGLVDKTAVEIWDEWYAPFFAYIHENEDVIRGVAYINVDWHSQRMWKPASGNGYWGDSRVQANDTILANWQQEMVSDFWLHGSPELFETLGNDGH